MHNLTNKLDGLMIKGSMKKSQLMKNALGKKKKGLSAIVITLLIVCIGIGLLVVLKPRLSALVTNIMNHTDTTAETFWQ